VIARGTSASREGHGAVHRPDRVELRSRARAPVALDRIHDPITLVEIPIAMRIGIVVPARAVARAFRWTPAVVLIPCVAVQTRAQAGPSTGTIDGIIRSASEHRPLSDVLVTIDGLPRTARSAADGRFRLPDVPAGTWTLVARRIGVESAERAVTVHAGRITSIELELREVPAVIEPVVVSATGERERRSEASATIDVLTGGDIQLARASHPAELLNRLPGVHAAMLSGEGHSMAIRQPITTKPMYLYLEDGIPTRATGFFNHNALYEVNIPQAGGVEVLKGPGTALYGSDAIGGVVNVLTRPAPPEPTVDVSVEGGAYGYARLLASAGTPFAEGGVRADLNLTRSDGWRDGSGYSRQSGTIRWDHAGAITARTVLTATHVNQHDVYTLDQARFDRLSPVNRSPIAFRTVEAVRLSSAIERERGSTRLSITPYARYDVLDLIPYWQLSYDPQVWDTRNTSVGMLASWRRDFTPLAARLIAGVDADYSPGRVTVDSVASTPVGPDRIWASYTTGARQYDYDVTYRALSPYVHAELSPFARLRIELGMRFDAAGYRYDTRLPATDSTERRHRRPPSTTVSYAHLSPKLGGTFALGSGLSLYGSYRHGFRAPSQSQLFQQGAAANTVDLAPVKVDSYEAGLRGERGQRLLAQLSVYDMVIHDDIITYITPDNQRIATNAGETRHRGIEASVSAALTAGLRLEASYSLSRQTYVHWAPSASVRYDGKRMEQAPRDLASALLSYAPALLGGGRVAIEWMHTGPYPMDPANTHEYGGHDLLNLHVNAMIGSRVELFARAMNVTDRRYAEVASYDPFQGAQYNPGMPRAVYAGVRYDWQRAER
jgi:iron complex outermembrane receptor protein